MKKFDNLQAAIHNLKDIYSYQEPYGNVEMTGIVRYVLNKRGKQ